MLRLLLSEESNCAKDGGEYDFDLVVLDLFIGGVGFFPINLEVG